MTPTQAPSARTVACPFCAKPVRITKRYAEPWVRDWHPPAPGCDSFKTGKKEWCRGSGDAVPARALAPSEEA
jgi:hypothetical protein